MQQHQPRFPRSPKMAENAFTVRGLEAALGRRRAGRQSTIQAHGRSQPWPWSTFLRLALACTGSTPALPRTSTWRPGRATPQRCNLHRSRSCKNFFLQVALLGSSASDELPSKNAGLVLRCTEPCCCSMHDASLVATGNSATCMKIPIKTNHLQKTEHPSRLPTRKSGRFLAR